MAIIDMEKAYDRLDWNFYEKNVLLIYVFLIYGFIGSCNVS